MRLLSLFGLDARLRRLRIAAGEGALAAEDRVQLLRLAWEEEKQRLQLMLVLVIAVIGLTTVAVALLSVAVVVHFWETPHRVAAAWVVAARVDRALGGRGRGADEHPAQVLRSLRSGAPRVRARLGMGRRTVSVSAASRRAAARVQAPEPRRAARAHRAPARAHCDAAGRVVGASADASPPDESASAAALRIAREHPVATGVVTAAVVAVLGPRRLLRWAPSSSRCCGGCVDPRRRLRCGACAAPGPPGAPAPAPGRSGRCRSARDRRRRRSWPRHRPHSGCRRPR